MSLLPAFLRFKRALKHKKAGKKRDKKLLRVPITDE